MLAILAGAALLLAGCAGQPGAAAVVDGHAISEQTVQDRTSAFIGENVTGGAADPNSPTLLALINRYQTTDVVRHQLVLAAARAEGITVTDEQVNQFIEQQGGTAGVAQQLTVPAADVGDAVHDFLVLQALLDKIPAGGVDVTDVTVTVDVVEKSTRDEAVAARAKYVKDPAAMAADAAAGRKANPNLPGGSESLLQNPQDALAGIFSIPEGGVVLLPEGTSGYYIIRVSQRTEKPAKLTKDQAQAASSLDGHLVLASLLLGRYPAAKNVSVNPRFGEWDPAMLLVVPSNSGL